MSIDELKQFQAKIIEKNNKCNKIGLLISFLLIALTILILIIFNILEVMLFILIFEVVISFIAVFIAKIITTGSDRKLFNKEFKNTFVLKALEKKFKDVTYNPEKGHSENEVNNIGFVNTADRYHSNDFIKANYKNITFEQSDIHIEEEHETTDSDGHTTTTWVTIFQGKLMIFDFNKTFKTNLIVASKYFRALYLPWGRKLSKVKMEDTEFNKTFKVYTESDHEAFYILTPHFMDKMKTLTKEINSSIIRN